MRPGVLRFVSNTRLLNDFVFGADFSIFPCLRRRYLELLACVFEGFKRLETWLSIPKGCQSFKMQCVKQRINTNCKNSFSTSDQFSFQ